MTARFPRLLATVLLALPLTTGLAACGKKGSPKPPVGQESAYTYPQAYPAPHTVVPGAEDESSQGSDPFEIFSGNGRSRTTTFE